MSIPRRLHAQSLFRPSRLCASVLPQAQAGRIRELELCALLRTGLLKYSILRHRTKCLRRGTFIQLLHPTGNVTQATEKMYFCSLHRPAGIGWQFGVGSMCQESGCIKHASFGVPGSKKALYCVLHKKQSHSNVKNRRFTNRSVYLT
ncbi:hypothetical protein GUITHDRAFT_110542 [Guillardia theta CCMP2712]|uniref:Uncharacterized protein n=1 Tax=Guillardia theta (strain CCMP2712) TaxID=905079 RepID=L1J5L8_GUITC|nr:hypothetical protein GUITHDRAFT_110542 [Guillardia theta CCMP2712]EKX43419.1 hypothetical protein GUITHDRAFT_110542 [Guillardia theta CCMP2712]|eukprot:XP_005830399.1 hypothetical protein GUITHDRAFT_110542 [Guillardia theta CCMP2712]